MAKYTFLNLAEETLLLSENSLTAQEIWEKAKKNKIDIKVASEGQTPWASVNARLIVDIRDNPKTFFIREVGRPARFALKNIDNSRARIESLNKDISKTGIDSTPLESIETIVFTNEKSTKYPYKERELHKFLVRFAHFAFRGAYSKTIFHETSSKKNYSEWLHPDLVGFWFPFHDYNKELLQLSGNGMAIAQFYSFEIKRELTLLNLRESFFQAVSNSSWANEGYLAAPNIDSSEDFRDELARLSGSFGIGVIELDLDSPQQSIVLFPARVKETIDWDGTNKLAKENPDFRKFLSDVRIDISNSRAHDSEFDKILSIDDLTTISKNWKT
ncbi:MAG: HTH domain-containing protein [Oxalobacteraceae bacterium]